MSLRTLVVLLACAAPGTGHAQTASERPVRRVEVDVGGGLLGGAALGSADANLRANAPARQPYRLFTADSEFVRTPVVHLRTAFAFSRRFGFEGALTLSRPDIRTSITADVEGGTSTTSTERVDQYFVEASLMMMLDALQVGDRMVPFVAGGGGYVRQLHEGDPVVEQGQVYHAGGGIKYWLLARDHGVVRATGLRGDARLYVTRHGISFDDRSRPHVALSGSVFVGF